MIKTNKCIKADATFIPIQEKDIEPVLSLFRSNVTTIEKERTVISVTFHRVTLCFKSSGRQTLTISYSSSDLFDWMNEKRLILIIRSFEKVAIKKGFKGVEIDIPNPSPLINALLSLDYENQFGGKKANGKVGKYGIFFEKEMF
ncbi:hypothetical protein [Halalkalibacterium halodurans]|uniref:BH1960 protein n=1 Tax=Halalkalibacterium halodurans (strain ATCC BAA-125 / DSM 18197 / FERM 7344 / JCM 9153 / C-125) TaxID=272558 RepID=Q9KBG7_HALH5|nr:hypothetical protein [Halalkalibacterium halodurans]MDY7222520.1 hypothetical protein [Halalkalibacterium halodurans]MDY7241741.1 hypothetical protein [Halalkalibacterium halodurans]MED4172788.1 hypothetical protein [Halalkalibacterium halodurans]BAB05679.1 BH1960 [Halalkalibacterium halodurans C-125]